MVIKTPRKVRPLLAVAAVALMGLVAVPTAGVADVFPPAYPPPVTAPNNQDSTLEDALKLTLGSLVIWWVAAS